MDFIVNWLLLFDGQLLRYIIVAGLATIVDVLTFTALMHTVFKETTYKRSDLIALSIGFSLGLITNFLLSKYYVFTYSQLGTDTQFIRFLVVALIVFGANYLLMRLLYRISRLFPRTLVDHWDNRFDIRRFKHLFIRGFSAGLIAFFSFLLHKWVSFES
jgi:putative flippase GtrA